MGTRLCLYPDRCCCNAYQLHNCSYLDQRVGQTPRSLNRGLAIEWVDRANARAAEPPSRSDDAKSTTTCAIVQSENLVCTKDDRYRTGHEENDSQDNKGKPYCNENLGSDSI